MPNKKQKGNLLINVLVSLGIIAMMMAISMPFLNQYQTNLKLNAITKDFVSDIRYAQQLTITEQATHIVSCDIGTDSYEIMRSGIATTTIKAVYFPSGINFQEITGLTDNQIKFNSYGGVSEAGQIFIINDRGRIAEINIKPSGYIQLLQ